MDDRDLRALHRVYRAVRVLKRELDQCSDAALEVFDLEMACDIRTFLRMGDDLAGVLGVDDDDDE